MVAEGFIPTHPSVNPKMLILLNKHRQTAQGKTNLEFRARLPEYHVKLFVILL